MKGKRKVVRVFKICKKCPHYQSYNTKVRTGEQCDLTDSFPYFEIERIRKLKFKARPIPKKCPYQLEHMIFNKKENKKYYN